MTQKEASKKLYDRLKEKPAINTQQKKRPYI